MCAQYKLDSAADAPIYTAGCSRQFFANVTSRVTVLHTDYCYRDFERTYVKTVKSLHGATFTKVKVSDWVWNPCNL